MRCINYLGQSWYFEGTSAVSACLAPSSPSSRDSSIPIVSVFGVRVVDPTVGGGLAHSPGPSGHPMCLALVIN